jgi:hypothetical protein
VERAQGEIDPQTGRPFTGDRLIERVGQMWFGGPGSAIDGGGSDAFGRLTLYDYGVKCSPGTSLALAIASRLVCRQRVKALVKPRGICQSQPPGIPSPLTLARAPDPVRDVVLTTLLWI